MSIERGIQVSVECAEANNNFSDIRQIIESTLKNIATSFKSASIGSKRLDVNGEFINHNQQIDKKGITQKITDNIAHLAKEYTVDVKTTSVT